jgi:hypothetical protein
MSAFVSDEIGIKPEYKDCLIEALEARFGKGNVEFHETAQPLIGYQGDVRTTKANVIVRRRFVGGSSNDIGYEFRDGKCVEHVSEFDQGIFKVEQRRAMYAKYAENVLAKVAKKRGWMETGRTVVDGVTKVRLKKRVF